MASTNAGSCVDQDESVTEQQKNGRGSVAEQRFVSATPTRRAARIIRTKERTVKLCTTAEHTALSESPSIAGTGYSTVESNSFDIVEALNIRLQANTPSRDARPATENCGWRVNEHAQNSVVRNYSDSVKGSTREMTLCARLYTGTNAKLSRRREQYHFKHFFSVADHMKHYRDNFAYSQAAVEVIQYTAKENEDETCPRTTAETVTPELNRRLRELASQLGVQHSTRESQLPCSHQSQLPPSSFDTEDWVTCSPRPMWYVSHELQVAAVRGTKLLMRETFCPFPNAFCLYEDKVCKSTDSALMVCN